ncbi:MAG: hypothetical protein IPO81_18165 [Kouleothrix sp.]|nr:hypothetical protein [Kouleothrix sp.]
MTTFTPIERAAYATMQARLIVLLLRHDEDGFRRFIDARPGFTPDAEDAVPRRYRELGVLFFLRDELFEHILPRIVRRLSFESPRSTIIEEPPARGRIDWARTLDATWAERPGEPPLVLHTRQRRRDFATPENVLTVATLLEYRADVQRVLWSERGLIGNEALRHPLNEIVEQCDRELAFPQFAGLRRAAQQIIESDDTETLEAQVHERLIPGGNSAYEDLLTWRARRRSLRLLRRDQIAVAEDVLGADPDEDDYLYQLWLFYELVDLLQRHGCLLSWSSVQAELTYVWGTGDDRRQYRLRHDRAIRKHWRNAPGVRPDLYIAHVERNEVWAGADLSWHEPGFVLDAKYYKPRDSSRAPASTIKRMIADLRLTGEQHGALLFAFQRDTRVSNMSNGESIDASEYEPDTAIAPATPTLPLYRVTPEGTAAQRGAPDEAVAVWRVWPRLGSERATEQILSAILDEAHATLRERRVPRCQGVFLDSLSAAAGDALHDRWGKPLEASSRDLLVCPKPHIGAWRVDIVSRTIHCCADARLCHIMGQPGAQKPIRPPRDVNDLLTELEHMLGESGQAELDAQGEAAAAIAERVQRLTRTYAEFANVDFDFYYNRLRDLGMAQTLDMLGPVERESLALSEFLKDQLDRIKASDFSAPAIHISSVMEVEIRRRVYQCPDIVGDLANPKKQTLGVLPYLRRSDDPDGNWQRIQSYVAAHWNEHPDPDDPDRCVRFDDLIAKAINRIAQLRNTAAHTNPLPRQEYTDLQKLIFQGGKLGYSALNALLLGWRHAR